ncbi:hypothetical protein BU17DRAFT_42687, partial [Hysterangium stoloniferum]
LSIVAIHGLDRHRETSFTAPNGVLWLRDLLPRLIPNARILTYGYDARTRGENRSQQGLYDLSTNFIAHLSNYRVDTKTDKRPLIFVAHSFGGIMLKNALIHAHIAGAKHLPEHKAVESSTYGVIYLGTPHQGIDLTSWTHSLLKCLSINSLINDPLLKHLGLHSETLQQQLMLYNAISIRYHTIFCYEVYPTKVQGGSSTHVPIFSAIVPGSTNTEVFGLHKNHMSLVQFSSMDDDYFTLARNLLRMVEKAPSGILPKWSTNNPGKVHPTHLL